MFITRDKETDGITTTLTAMFFRQIVSKELGNVSIIIRGEASIKDYIYLGGRYVDVDLIELEVVKSEGGEEIQETERIEYEINEHLEILYREHTKVLATSN
tara:strand:- start:244 stop:546 length:303 start_codon:yes stop_codon:yes gene_type:complete